MPNRLSGTDSPYLLQHAGNPVDWWPWCDDAFEEARSRDVPVFLSIGYATCHWCHVMAHESFEDDDVADVLNGSFVSVKVDREDRPDIDAQFMAVCQLIGRHCGWPLTVFLTPDRKPFYVATYLPKTGRFGRPGMLDLLPRVETLWRDERSKVEASADEIVTMLAGRSALPVHDEETDLDGAMHAAYRTLASGFDGTYGGFGPAPKFPSPQNLTFLLRYGHVFDESRAVEMARDTILAMGRSGTFDQVGGGFHRYATDVEWRLPHFEKMLHDQALMLDACVDGWLATRDDALRDVGVRTATYVLRDLRGPDGGFYSAEDADSEGEEGRFYTWTHEDLTRALGPDMEACAHWFGIEVDGNFLEEATRERTGRNVLHQGPEGTPPDRATADRIRRILLETRASRVRPLRDEKVMTDWNGLMIRALARAAAAWDRPDLGHAAEAAARFVDAQMQDRHGRLLHRWFRGRAAVPALLDDYAYLASGHIALYEWTRDPDWIERAMDLAAAMLDACDAPSGGFFHGSRHGESLLVRQEQWYDGAMPTGISVALGVLTRLGHLTGDAKWLDRADRVMQAAASLLRAAPTALTGLLSESFAARDDARQIVLADGDGYEALLGLIRSRMLPDAVVLYREQTSMARLETLAPFTAAQGSIEGRAAAYVCRHFVCEAPVTTPEALAEMLGR